MPWLLMGGQKVHPAVAATKDQEERQLVTSTVPWRMPALDLQCRLLLWDHQWRRWACSVVCCWVQDCGRRYRWHACKATSSWDWPAFW